MLTKIQIYVASSWKNTYQPAIVELLRSDGHEVYDFKAPVPGDDGFHWREIDPGWKSWTPLQYWNGLNSPLAARGFQNDMSALDNADLCVLVMPSGKSASWEYGYWRGRTQRHGVLHIPAGEPFEPELMFKGADITWTLDGLRQSVRMKKAELIRSYEASRKHDEDVARSFLDRPCAFIVSCPRGCGKRGMCGLKEKHDEEHAPIHVCPKLIVTKT